MTQRPGPIMALGVFSKEFCLDLSLPQPPS